MSDSTEYVLRQELRTLQVMNDSRSREIERDKKYIERLKGEKRELVEVLIKSRSDLIKMINGMYLGPSNIQYLNEIISKHNPYGD